MTIKHNFLFLLVIGAILSGCVSKGAVINGTYTNKFKEDPSFKTEYSQEITFYNDGTWFFKGPLDTNSGVFTIHDKEILATASIGSENFKIQIDGSLTDSKNRTWIKKP